MGLTHARDAGGRQMMRARMREETDKREPYLEAKERSSRWITIVQSCREY